MSTIKANNHQIGQSPTASNNFTLYQPSTPDGTVRLGVGNSGATTADVMTVTGSTNATVFAGSVKSAATGFIFPDNTTQTTAATTAFAAGTKLAFPQASAPTGWTQDTSVNDYAMRIVSGTGGGTGGSVAFTTAFASGNTGATTLSTSEMPSHFHNLYSDANLSTTGTFYSLGSPSATALAAAGPTTWNTGGWDQTNYAGYNWVSSTGGGGSHTHSLSLAVQYKDFIIATKN